MKRVYLLRHAKAAGAEPAKRDFDRPLAETGAQDAAALGRMMVQKTYHPALALCSGAARTRETLALLALPETSTQLIDDALYEASAGDLLASIQGCDDKAKSVMIVGHNPAIHELALRLTSEDSGLSLAQRLKAGYAPGTLAVLDVPCACWNDIQLGENFLIDLLAPIDYNAPDRPTRWM